MGCVQSSEDKADAPQQQKQQSLSEVAGPSAEERQRSQAPSVSKAKDHAKSKLLDKDLAELTAVGLVHENYTFDQGGTLGATQLVARPFPIPTFPPQEPA